MGLCWRQSPVFYEECLLSWLCELLALQLLAATDADGVLQWEVRVELPALLGKQCAASNVTVQDIGGISKQFQESHLRKGQPIGPPHSDELQGHITTISYSIDRLRIGRLSNPSGPAMVAIQPDAYSC